MAAAFVQDDLFAAPEELPQGLRYEPGFVTPAEQAALIAQIETLPLREAKFREYFARRRVAHFHDGVAATAYDDGAADSVDHGPDRMARRSARSRGCAPRRARNSDRACAGERISSGYAHRMAS